LLVTLIPWLLVSKGRKYPQRPGSYVYTKSTWVPSPSISKFLSSLRCLLIPLVLQAFLNERVVKRKKEDDGCWIVRDLDVYSVHYKVT
jgi:hypothetical protein